MKNFKIIIAVAVIAALTVGGYMWKVSQKSVCCPHDAPAVGHHEQHDDHADHKDHGDEHSEAGHDDHGKEDAIHLSKESMALGGIETAVVSQVSLNRIISVNGRVTQDAETEDMTQVAAVFDIYESNFSDVRVGQSIDVFALTDADHKHSGEITFVSFRVDALTNTLKVRAVINNADLDWKLGMFLKGEILIDAQGTAIAVSSQAVQTLEGKPVVFVRSADDEFEARAITIASQNNEIIFVSQGLKEGEEIVVNGSFIMKSKTMENEMEHSHDH